MFHQELSSLLFIQLYKTLSPIPAKGPLKSYGTYSHSQNDITNLKLRDAVTPTQDWLITPHPKVPGLFIAAGGSFHSWKFLPTIGIYVVRMVRGELDEDSEEARRWAWDKEAKGSACPMYWPSRDLADA